MTRARALITGCIGAIAFAAGAHAADPPGSWRPLPPEHGDNRPPYQELLSGWYLRGDIGMRWNSIDVVSAARPVTGNDYSSAVSGTVGFGYKYQWFRTDLTVDKGVPSRATASTASGAQPQYSAKIDAVSAMANVYADLGTWWSFTPYIGAGFGMTQLKSKNYVDTTPPLTDVTQPGKALNFTWAVMAGAAYRVAPNWMIDVGYRYLSMGDVPGIDGAGQTNNAAVFKNLTAHEARVGFRFLFD